VQVWLGLARRWLCRLAGVEWTIHNRAGPDVGSSRAHGSRDDRFDATAGRKLCQPRAVVCGNRSCYGIAERRKNGSARIDRNVVVGSMTRDEVRSQGGPQRSTDYHCARSGWHVTTGDEFDPIEAMFHRTVKWCFALDFRAFLKAVKSHA
jgi:hypothetical protein